MFSNLLKSLRVAHPLYAIRDTHSVRSPKDDARRVIMQNKPNFLNNPMNITPFVTNYYNIFSLLARRKNKPNSNPNQSKQTQFHHRFTSGKPYAKTPDFEYNMSSVQYEPVKAVKMAIQFSKRLKTMNFRQITKNHPWPLLAAILVILTVQTNTSFAQQNDKPASLEKGKLLVATCQLPISGSVPTNAEWIRGQMRKARAQNATIAHFPECALSGYSGVAYKNMENFDWKQLHAETESIMKLADELDLWVVLGTAHRLTGQNKPHNCLYVISPQGKIVTRYDKRFCTSGDLKHYSPGDYFATFEVNGVRCGLLICYDVRFPEVYRQYHKLGVQVMFHSFHNGGMTEDNILPQIMPTTVQARAASNYMFVSANNSCVKHSWQSFFATPNGLVEKRLPLDEPGVMVNLADTQKKYYDASRRYRLDCIDGKYNSGDAVDDPRSNDRQGY